MGLVIEIVYGCYQTVRETLPASHEEAGVWMAGFVWAFCLHWVILIAVTYWSVTR